MFIWFPDKTPESSAIFKSKFNICYSMFIIQFARRVRPALSVVEGSHPFLFDISTSKQSAQAKKEISKTSPDFSTRF